MPSIPIITTAGHARLDVRRIETAERIALDAITGSVELQAKVDAAATTLAVKMIARIAGKQFDTKAVSYPATWWDGFKLACLPTFCRWVGHEPKMHTEVMEASAFYPTVQIPNHKPFVQVTLRKGGQQ